jgi:hypothetical protein
MQRGPSRQQNIDNAATCSCFLNYLAFIRPAADRAVPILPLVVSRGRKYGLFLAASIIQKNVRKENPIPVYSPVSDRRRLTALVDIHWARRVQAPQISGPNLQENHITETCKHHRVLFNSPPGFLSRNFAIPKSNQVELLITNKAFCIVQRATAQ